MENLQPYLYTDGMRIIAGKLGGLQFNAPRGNRTHPMSERIRGALFNALGNIANYRVLDAYAGSGAVAFEAVSRGASQATAVDSDKNAVSAMKEAVQKLGLTEQCKVTRANVASWSDNNPDATYDLVVIDPPYDNIKLPVIQKLIRHIDSKGLLVVSWPGKVDQPDLEGLEIEDVKDYGDAQLIFYRRV